MGKNKHKKKRKREEEIKLKTGQSSSTTSWADVDTTKPTATFKPVTGGRESTLSIALPGSILSNAQSQELKTLLAGQIGRAAAVFCVDEIVIFDDSESAQPVRQNGVSHGHKSAYSSSYTGDSDPNGFLDLILQYLEAPPHIKRAQFGMLPNLRYAGLLPSLDMPHHKTMDASIPYFEGVVVDKYQASNGYDEEYEQDWSYSQPSKRRKKETPGESGPCEVALQAGLKNLVTVTAPTYVESGTRLTLRVIDGFAHSATEITAAEIVPATAPRVEGGYYWGYKTRRASSLSSIFEGSSVTPDGIYNLTIGTSERGISVSSVIDALERSHTLPSASSNEEAKRSKKEKRKRKKAHILLVFGGVAGLEYAAKNDPALKADGKSLQSLFDYWVNLVPNQGSRTIRTEEAVWIGLSSLQDVIGNMLK